MKRILASLAIAGLMTTQAAYAGGLSDPIVDDTVIVDETASSSGDILIPILFLVFGGAVAAG